MVPVPVRMLMLVLVLMLALNCRVQALRFFRAEVAPC
jgi:hypothetical protein